MSTPDSNGDDVDAMGPMNQNSSVETAERQSPTTEPHGSGRVTDEVDDGEASSDRADRISELEALVDELRAENDELRGDYARARLVSYRETALALAAVGVVAVFGGVALPDVRAVLFVTGAIGLFSGVMTWYITPARVVPVGVSESAYDAATTTLAVLRDELGLQPVTVYVPISDRTRGYIPRHRDFEVPGNVAHAFPGDTTGSEGLCFAPSGEQLTREVGLIRTTSPDTALEAVEQVGDSLVRHFEVADGVVVEEATGGRAFTISVDDPAFGPLTRLDHPVVSALACAAAQAGDDPVVVTATERTAVTLETLSGTDD